MIKAIMIDFGGVLVRTEDQTLRRKWELQLNLVEGALSKLMFDSDVSRKALLGLEPESAIWNYIASKLSLNPAESLNPVDLEQLKSDFWKFDSLDHDLVEYLKSLRKKYIICILSNAWTGARRLFTETYHLDEMADKIIISSEVGLVKPDIRIYELAATKLNLKPEEIIFIDDFAENIEGARQSGMNAIQFTGPMDLYKTLGAMLGE